MGISWPYGVHYLMCKLEETSAALPSCVFQRTITSYNAWGTWKIISGDLVQDPSTSPSLKLTSFPSFHVPPWGEFEDGLCFHNPHWLTVYPNSISFLFRCKVFKG